MLHLNVCHALVFNKITVTMITKAINAIVAFKGVYSILMITVADVIQPPTQTVTFQDLTTGATLP